MDELTKICSQCGQAKPLNAFYKAKECQYGVMAECKVCNKARTKADQLRPKIAIEMKECSQCHAIKTASEFYRAARSTDGLQAECKECHKERLERCERDKSIIEKTCTQCGMIQIAAAFYDNPINRDGIDTFCIPCRKASNAQWNKSNPDKRKPIANKAAKKARQNPEMHAKMIANTKAWKETHPEAVSRHGKTSWEKRKGLPTTDKAKQKKKEWFAERPGYKRAAAHKRRALIKQAPIIDAHINIEILYTRDNGVCALCHQRIDKRLKWPDLMCATIDHIVPLTKGGSHAWANVALAHHRCNTMKNNGTVTQQMRLF